jgi:acetyl-CoA carboxylase carboxyltransferase component
MHSRTSGLSDYLAEDERDALRLGRAIVARLHWRKLGSGPTEPALPPVHDIEDLLGLAPADLRTPVAIREVLARILDGSLFDEFKPLYGPNLVTGWGSVHGFPVGVLANDRGVLYLEEAQKAAQFIQLANRIDVPLLFAQNTTGYIVGTEFEQRGMIKDGAKMINAVANSGVPHLTLMLGASYGAGNYGMGGWSYNPRFVFSWPNAKTAVMGPAQLAGVLSIVGRAAAEASGRPFDEEADTAMRASVEDQIERESLAPFVSGRLFDDGIIDPRDSRTVLGLTLSAVHSGEIKGTDAFGVFRM